MSIISQSDSEYSSSDEEVNITISFCAFTWYILTYFLSRVQLQEAFTKGLLKSGLNAVVETNKQPKNCVVSYQSFKNDDEFRNLSVF